MLIGFLMGIGITLILEGLVCYVLSAVYTIKRKDW